MLTNRRFGLVLEDYAKHLVLIGSLMILAYFPLISTQRMTWDSDTWFHLMRIREMNVTIKAQQLPNLISMNSFGNVGQAIAGIYPSWTLMPFVWVTKNLSPITQWYVIGALIVITTSLVMYIVLTQLISTRWWCHLGAIAYAFSTISVGFVTNGNLGTTLGLIFLPLVAYGLILILRLEKNYADVWIGLGVGLLLLTHVMSALLSIIFVMIVAGYCVFKRRDKLVDFFKSGLIAALIGLPTLILNLLLLGQIMSPSWFDLTKHTLNIPDVLGLSSLLSLKYAYWNISLISLIVLLVSVIYFKQFKVEKILIGVAVGFLFIATDVFPWQSFKDGPLAIIQFPGRLVVFPFVVLFILAMVVLEQRFQKWQVLKTVMIGLFGLALVVPFIQIQKNYDKLTSYPHYATTGYNSRGRTTLDNATFKLPSFNDTRVYIDYMPSQMTPYTVKLASQHVGSSASNAMVDVVKYHSVRPRNYVLKDMNVINHYGSYVAVPQHVKQQNQASDFQQLNTNTLKIKTTVSQYGVYELPFWGYKGLDYDVTINGQPVKTQISQYGRLLALLRKGDNTITIHSRWPIVYVVSVIIMGTTFLILTMLIIFNAIYHSNHK